MMKRGPKKAILIAAGCVCLALATLGIVLPILPTTPLVLVAAYCFFNSSQRLHTWLIQHPRFGPAIQRVQRGQGITLRVKIYSLAAAYILVGTTIVFLDILLVRIFLVLLMVVKTIFMIRFPTYREETASQQEKQLSARKKQRFSQQ